MAFYFYMLTLIATVDAATHKLRLCLDNNQIRWRHFPPYFEQNTDLNQSGIAINIFRDAMRACCRGHLNLNFTGTFDNQGQVMNLTESQAVDFIIPVQGMLKSKTFLNVPFVSLIESPGLAFYVVEEHGGTKVLYNALSSVAPLVALMFLMVAISGTLFWMCESMALAWIGNKPQSFPKGVLEGFWWSFVSMTTVGYGDIIPKTKPGKIFSLLWVLIGIASCALFTSSLTTILTLSLMHKQVTFSDTKVAVLQGSEEYNYAVKKHAKPVTFQNIDDIVEALIHKRVSSALIEVYVAAEHQLKLNRFELKSIIEHMSSSGVLFLNNGFFFATCIRDYVLSKERDIIELVSKRVKALTVERYDLLGRSSSVFSLESPGLYVPIVSLCGVLVSFVLLGILRDWRKKRIASIDNNIGELTLSEWRREYKVDLSSKIKAIKNDMEKIKRKAEIIMRKVESYPSGLVKAKLKSERQQYN